MCTFRYIDDVLSLNKSKFGDFADGIYLIKFEIRDITDRARPASYLDKHLENEWGLVILRTKHSYDKLPDFNFPTVNIPAAPAYVVHISQLIRYSRAFGFYLDFPDFNKEATEPMTPSG